MARCEAVVERTASEFGSWVAGAAQQDFALGNCMVPQFAIGRGWQQWSAAIAATGATQASAGPASSTTARASAPPLRNKAMVESLCPQRRRGK